MGGVTMSARTGSEFQNPTQIVLNANLTVPTTARLALQVFETAGGYTLTLLTKRSQFIFNAGNYTFTLICAGNTNTPVNPGDQLYACWDTVAQVFRLLKGSLTVDAALSNSSTNPVQNMAVKAAIDALGGGGGGSGVSTFDTVALLRASATIPALVVVKGHTAAWDGGGGIFDLLAASGGTVGDVDAAGHDDNGWHIVCTSTGAVYGRRDTTVTPQHFGAIGSVDDTAAAAAADIAAKVQRAVKFQLQPATFAGWNYRSRKQPLRFYAPDALYRCESTINVAIPLASPYQNTYVPGEIEWCGRVWTPRTIAIPAFTINAGRNVGKPKATFRACKQKAADGKVVWNADSWPDLWRDAAAYRPWAASTVFYAGEEITQVLGSGATALYCVTVSGTSGGSAPTHTTGTAANGGTTLEWLGTIKTTGGKSAWELARDCRDIGIHIDSCLEWQTLTLESDGYTIHVAEVPRNAVDSQVGFTRFQGNAFGCKFGLYAASYLYDHLVANQAARLALTGVPIGAVVRQSDDATNDYRFAGPAGGEATNGNWTAHAKNPADNWCNENRADASLWYGRDGGTYIATDKSVYGFVSTKINTASSIPTQHVVDGISIEFTDMTGGEMVQALIDYGAECVLSSRNDHESIGRAFVTVKHADTTKEPYRNVMRVARAGRWIASAVWSKDESCGRQNRVIQTPGRHEFAKEFICHSLFADAVFSSYNKVYWQNVSIWQHSLTKPQASCLYKFTYGSANYCQFNPMDLSFNFSVHECPCVIVDLPDNHRGDAIIEVEHFQSVITETPRTLFAIVDPITGQVGDYSARPRVPISGNLTLSHALITSTLPVLQTSSPGSSVVGQFSPEPWIKRLVVRLCGTNLVGFRVRVLESKNASVWSPGASYRKMPGPWTAAKPERGIYRAPCRLWYEDQTGVNKGCFLNKVGSETDWWATSGTTGSIGAPAQYQLGHDGAGVVKEWDGSAWQTVASGVSTLDPADWVNFT